jgi:membrane protein
MRLGIFSAIFFSAAIVTNDQDYGPIGVILIIMSWLVAIGSVLVLGALVGAV